MQPSHNPGGPRPGPGRVLPALAGICVLLPGAAWAAPAGPDAAPPGLAWALPFALLLAAIALLPMLAPRLWHRRMGLVAAACGLAFLVPLALQAGATAALASFWHAVLIEYLPFATLLLALFAAGGGILLEGGPWGRPAGNTLLLAVGMALAGVMGTTGVSMMLIHPLLRANAHRRHRVHLVVFFILLVANAGGATTPLGDPPLYIGFLHGVPFAWPLLHLTEPMLVLAALLLPAFWLLDRRLARADGDPAPDGRTHLRIRGWANVGIVAAIVATVLVQGVWHPGDAVLLGQAIGIERLAAMGVFLAATLLSVRLTSHRIRQANMFTWEPMEEIGKLFLAIFVTIAPVMAMLSAGLSGPLAPLLRLTLDGQGQPSPLAYFWLTGGLSAFLDNAPTYLVFLQLAGDDPATLIAHGNDVLRGLASGAVFFGALTYIGNAPNLMVRSIAAHRGVRMPGFFGYMAWSCGLMLPCFVVLTLIFFR